MTSLDFNRTERRIVKGVIAVWVVCILISLAFLGLISWAVVMLVLHIVA